ncbi:hypothetical protein, partial [Escherichia coli]|uniref:hypothetical protein n=1 Tax=Escherichia coli TaxID=562 RepID=UPI00200BF9B5
QSACVYAGCGDNALSGLQNQLKKKNKKACRPDKRSESGNYVFGISLKPAPDRAGFGFLS